MSQRRTIQICVTTSKENWAFYHSISFLSISQLHPTQRTPFLETLDKLVRHARPTGTALEKRHVRRLTTTTAAESAAAIMVTSSAETSEEVTSKWEVGSRRWPFPRVWGNLRLAKKARKQFNIHYNRSTRIWREFWRYFGQGRRRSRTQPSHKLPWGLSKSRNRFRMLSVGLVSRLFILTQAVTFRVRLLISLVLWHNLIPYEVLGCLWYLLEVLCYPAAKDKLRVCKYYLAYFTVVGRVWASIVLSFDRQVCFHIKSLSDSSEKRSSIIHATVWFQEKEQNIFSSKTHLDGTTHGQTIICRQLFAGHVGALGQWKGREKCIKW